MPHPHTITAYRFSELSEKARERAKMDHSAHFSYPWSDDAIKSIEALAAHFGGKVDDYSIDWFGSSYSSMSFEMPEMPKAEIRSRLLALGKYDMKTLRGLGDCKLTGFCMDDSAIDGFRLSFIRGKESDLNQLMQSAFDLWLKDCQSDCEAMYEDAEFGETSDANNWEYDKYGELL